jgi:hypothetical protein
MKKLLLVLCLILPLSVTAAESKSVPKKKCTVEQKCKKHQMLKGTKIPERSKKK